MYKKQMLHETIQTFDEAPSMRVVRALARQHHTDENTVLAVIKEAAAKEAEDADAPEPCDEPS